MISTNLAAALFRLERPLDLQAGVMLRDAGIGQTILAAVISWKALTDTRPVL